MRFRLAVLALLVPASAFSANRICTVASTSLMSCGNATAAVQCDGYDPSETDYIKDGQAIVDIKFKDANGKEYNISQPKASVRDFILALKDYQSGNSSSSTASAELQNALHGAKAAQLSIETFTLSKSADLYGTCQASNSNKATPSDLAQNQFTPPNVDEALSPLLRNSAPSTNDTKSSISDGYGESGSGGAGAGAIKN
jgi:hypothetical protein